MPEKIMVVDDEPDLESLIRQYFRRKIRNNEFEFLFARNGIEALELLENNADISLLLSDINMPEMDGLTLLQKTMERGDEMLKTIIVSAYGDMDNIRTAMNRGAFDFITKPIDFADLEVTVDKTLEQIKRIRKATEDRNRLIALQQDITVARNIQLSILPKDFPPFPGRDDVDIYASMNAARDVGGDFYDFFFIDDNRLGLVMADVSGKGIPASLFMAVSKTMIKAIALNGARAEDCIAAANNLLCQVSVDGMFVTVFYGILDVTTGQINYINAGHPSPCIIKKDGTVKQLVLTNGTALGVFEKINYTSGDVTIDDSDIIYLYTDGVNEAMDMHENQYTDKRLIERLKELGDSTVETVEQKITEDLKEHTRGAIQSDDITMMAVKLHLPRL
ncbi:MAG: SpoIIE family protein phosphatase [Chitinispirillaceae bacterium]|nr:SpoIIE family protein phosphatase [Chitinispirillaceae bacterium]